MFPRIAPGRSRHIDRFLRSAERTNHKMLPSQDRTRFLELLKKSIKYLRNEA